MIANGKVQLYDQFGLAGEFNVSLQAEPPGEVGGALMWLAEPANNIQLVSILLALWVISSGKKRKEKRGPNEDVQTRQHSDQIVANSADAFIIDGYENQRQ